MKKYLLDIPVKDVLRFQDGLFAYIEGQYPEIPANIRAEGVLSLETEEKLSRAVTEYKKEF